MKDEKKEETRLRSSQTDFSDRENARQEKSKVAAKPQPAGLIPDFEVDPIGFLSHVQNSPVSQNALNHFANVLTAKGFTVSPEPKSIAALLAEVKKA